jgi:hypothetical protein
MGGRGWYLVVALLAACDPAEPTGAGPVTSSAPVAIRAPVAASSSADPAISATPSAPKPTPEELAKRMTGSIPCGKQTCRAGKEVCVSAPDPAHVTHCEPIRKWAAGKTPVPLNGSPAMAGLTVCDGSFNCPEGSVCCLHDINSAEVQAVVCHADLSECRDKVESCNKTVTTSCRTPGTKCTDFLCEP